MWGGQMENREQQPEVPSQSIVALGQMLAGIAAMQRDQAEMNRSVHGGASVQAERGKRSRPGAARSTDSCGSTAGGFLRVYRRGPSPDNSRGRCPVLPRLVRGNSGGMWLACCRCGRSGSCLCWLGRHRQRPWGLPPAARQSYPNVRKAVIDRMGLSPEDHRRRFREARLGRWLQPGGPGTALEVVEKLVLKQFVGGLPSGTAAWVRCHRPSLLVTAITLAEDHLAVHSPGKGGQRSHAGFVPANTCPAEEATHTGPGGVDAGTVSGTPSRGSPSYRPTRQAPALFLTYGSRTPGQECWRYARAPSEGVTPSVDSEPPELSAIPSVYQDLCEAFSKKQALSIPPHRPYDCAINLLLAGEPLALQSGGDVVIGGLFPLHYVAPKQQQSYHRKPRNTPCGGFDHRAFRWIMTMVFAVEEINRNLSLLPGVHLGYRIMDSCDHVHTGLKALLSLENETGETIDRSTPSQTLPTCLADSPVPAVIGLASSSPTRAVAHTLGPFNFPLVSYFATCTCLTDKSKYPSFLRTVPSDLFQVRGLVQMVTYLGWFWVGTIGTTDDYSHYAIQEFSSQFRQQGGCLAFHLTIPKLPTAAEIQEIADRIQSSTAVVVVVFARVGELLDLSLELAQRNATGIQWVASEAWVTASLLTSPRFHSLLEGTLGFSFPGVRIPGLKEFLLNIRPSPKPGMAFVNMFWEELFRCRLEFKGNQSADANYKGAAEKPVCTGSEDVKDIDSSFTDVSQVRVSYNVYKAVYAIAHALHTLLNCDSGEHYGRCENRKTFTSRQLLQYLKKVNFTNQFEEKISFDSNGEPVPLYDIINWQKDSKGEIRFIKVGSYDGFAPLKEQLQIKQSTIVWTSGQSEVPASQCSSPCSPGSRQARRPGEPHCCFDCLPCADGEISNQTGSTECTKCAEYYWSDRDQVKCVAGVEEFLSFHNIMGIILVTLTLLGVVLTTIVTAVFQRFRSTPIVKANNAEISFLLLLSLKLCFLCSLVFIGQPSVWTCRLRQALFGVSFVLCLSCLLVKTIVVLLAFHANAPGSRALKQFGLSQQRTLILCTTAPQIILCAGCLLGAPPFPFKNPNYHASTRKIVVECKEPWPPGFYLVLGYIGLLAFVCLILAFLGRKLPDTFNEAKLITFSMLIFWAVWISFIPAYVSSPGKFTVAVEVFAILASSFGLLLCIFVPKCYIILLRPQRNIKKGMTRKYLT
ncbi:extracellular calcium-sensing receptor-like [Cyclopterus lumpus]|uniref:extracellular calcium-sensing receptor-like n=1 Tax=Cyclopterus lumpus TaxID=8103 RepID=UPI0014875821|nr:extracellular calcium-sensing receptor-like [Cyclopterus lumpus]